MTQHKKRNQESNCNQEIKPAHFPTLPTSNKQRVSKKTHEIERPIKPQAKTAKTSLQQSNFRNIPDKKTQNPLKCQEGKKERRKKPWIQRNRGNGLKTKKKQTTKQETKKGVIRREHHRTWRSYRYPFLKKTSPTIALIRIR